MRRRPRAVARRVGTAALGISRGSTRRSSERSVLAIGAWGCTCRNSARRSSRLKPLLPLAMHREQIGWWPRRPLISAVLFRQSSQASVPHAWREG
jgi:hypothetical protein